MFDMNEMEYIKEIGKGSFGVAHLVRYGGEEMVLKDIIESQYMPFEKLKREVLFFEFFNFLYIFRLIFQKNYIQDT